MILAGILGLVFWLTFTVGAPLQEWLDTHRWRGWQALRAGCWRVPRLAERPGRGRSDRRGGLGADFLAILVIFFAAFGLLEDVGYMARAAYVMDNFMHLMGLHGKSFLPLFLGFGCNVPAIMGTRVIDSWPARLLTIWSRRWCPARRAWRWWPSLRRPSLAEGAAGLVGTGVASRWWCWW